MNYKEEIIRMLEQIDNEDFLAQIYYFAKVKYDKCKKDR